jgi:hypothetical protein
VRFLCGAVALLGSDETAFGLRDRRAVVTVIDWRALQQAHGPPES